MCVCACVHRREARPVPCHGGGGVCVSCCCRCVAVLCCPRRACRISPMLCHAMPCHAGRCVFDPMAASLAADFWLLWLLWLLWLPWLPAPACPCPEGSRACACACPRPLMRASLQPPKAPGQEAARSRGQARAPFRGGGRGPGRGCFLASRQSGSLLLCLPAGMAGATARMLGRRVPSGPRSSTARARDPTASTRSQHQRSALTLLTLLTLDGSLSRLACASLRRPFSLLSIPTGYS